MIQINVHTLPQEEVVYDSLRTTKDNIGVFQMGASVTSHYCHRHKAITCLDDMSDIATIIRPGMKDAILDDGKSATDHFISRKNGDEDITYLHPSLEKVLDKTVGLMPYQETMLLVASEIAGFTLVEADLLRQAIGKKKIDLMNKIGPKFIDGCQIHSNIPKETAEAIWGMIVSAGNYSFNKSHAASYAHIAYIDLWFRHHHPHLFYAASLAYEMLTGGDKFEKIKKIKRMIQSAKSRGIDVAAPNLIRRNIHTEPSIEENRIYLGFNAISGVGVKGFKSIFKKIEVIEKKKGSILDRDFLSVLIHFYKALGKTAMENFICCGLFDGIDRNRAGMLYDCGDWAALTEIEQKWIGQWYETARQPSGNMQEALQALISAPIGKGGGCANMGRLGAVRSLYNLSEKNRPDRTTDQWVMAKEESLMGICLTPTRIVGANLDAVNMKISDIKDPVRDCVIAIQCKEITVKTQKDGRDFAIIAAIDSDNSETDIFVFADSYKKYVELLYPNAQLLLHGFVSDRGSFVALKIEPIK